MKEEESRLLRISNVNIKVSNPTKTLFHKMNITKWNYVLMVSKLAPYLLPYCKDRLLTTIRFPDGPAGNSFYQKNAPTYTPNWIKTYVVKSTKYILLDNIETLVWLANLACLEFHTSFDKVTNEGFPTELVFDIDPTDTDFLKVIDVAFRTKEVLEELGLGCFVKTSGASGLQVYVPIKPIYTYEQTRMVSEFIAKYLAEKYSRFITIKRQVNKRGNKVYFDYLQHWRNKTLISPYSPRATEEATVSCPISWQELPHIHPKQFTLQNIFDYLEITGDLFKPILNKENRVSLDNILHFKS